MNNPIDINHKLSLVTLGDQLEVDWELSRGMGYDWTLLNKEEVEKLRDYLTEWLEAKEGELFIPEDEGIEEEYRNGKD